MAEGFLDSRNRGVQITDTLARPSFIQTNRDKAIIKSAAKIPNQNIVSTKKTKKPPKSPILSTLSSKPKGSKLPINSLLTKVEPKSVIIVDRRDGEFKEIPPDNFSTNGEIVLTGEYDQNKITFDRFSLSEIQAFDDISFQFILQIADSKGIKYFTSKDFLAKLQSANKNNTPYLPLEALNPASIVRVDLRPSLNGLRQQRALEEKEGAFVIFNTYVDVAGAIDYKKLVEYIDWVVSKPPADYDNRIIPAEELGRWSITDAVKGGGVTNTGGGTADPEPEGGGEEPIIIVDPPEEEEPTEEEVIIDTDPDDDPEPFGPPTDVERVNIPGTITINDEVFEITPLPVEMAGGSTPSGEGDIGNPELGSTTSRGGVLGGGNYSNPQEAIENEYKYRTKKTQREL